MILIKSVSKKQKSLLLFCHSNEKRHLHNKLLEDCRRSKEAPEVVLGAVWDSLAGKGFWGPFESFELKMPYSSVKLVKNQRLKRRRHLDVQQM